MQVPDVAVTTAAVVVVYRPRIDPGPTLTSLRQILHRVLLVDNDETGQQALADLAQTLGAGYLHAGNRGGLAGAYNRALARLHDDSPHIEQVVFLDEDSDPTVLRALLTDPGTVGAMVDPRTAAVAPAYRDRATGLRGKYMRLGRWSMRFHPREFAGLQPVAFVINSMAVWRVAVLQHVGAFNEALAIDHVDTEYCLRARRLGYGLLVNGSFEFAHAIGQRRKYRFLGMQLQAGGHAPARRFLIGRNTVWLARQWCLREPAFAALCLARVAYEAVGIAMAEDDAGAKLRALGRGVASGLLAPSRPG